NVEYFTEILHLFRSEMIYRAIVDEVLDVPKHAATRDTEAIKRICTGFMKLIFPNIRDASKLNIEEFEHYCLQPALMMRGVIKTQLGIIDTEFRGKFIPDIKVKDVLKG
ncbi:MAG: BREX system Lon protease-like protein BrxL, partial [Candidatus Desantisbacteria bacterium]